MYYVYYLHSLKQTNFNYIGFTDDLKRRFSEHNNKQVLSTTAYAPFKLVYYEAYRSKKDALKREKKLKHHGSVIGHLKKRISNSLKSSVKRAGEGETDDKGEVVTRHR